jgi:hypothetical protein
MTTPAQPTDLDRFLAALRKLVLHALPALKYWIVHEYLVVESDGVTFSGTPTDPDFSPALPVGVPYAPALAGSYSVVPVGTLAYVGFANADPSKPYLVRFGALATSTQTVLAASAVALAGTSGAAVARVDDFVARLFQNTATGIVYASTSTGAPYAWSPIASGIIPPTIADAGTAINITTGSGKVTSE